MNIFTVHKKESFIEGLITTLKKFFVHKSDGTTAIKNTFKVLVNLLYDKKRHITSSNQLNRVCRSFIFIAELFLIHKSQKDSDILRKKYFSLFTFTSSCENLRVAVFILKRVDLY